MGAGGGQKIQYTAFPNPFMIASLYTESLGTVSCLYSKFRKFVSITGLVLGGENDFVSWSYRYYSFTFSPAFRRYRYRYDFRSTGYFEHDGRLRAGKKKGS